MKHNTTFKRVVTACAALVVASNSLFGPAGTALAESAQMSSTQVAAQDSGTLQPVWCKFTGKNWQVQLSATAEGKDGALTIDVDGYQKNSDGQVIAHDRSDKILADACAQQYTVAAPAATPVCGANNDEIKAGLHMAIITETPWENNQKTVTFTADYPYAFMISDGVYASTFTKTYTDTNEACPVQTIEIPAMPELKDLCGLNNAEWKKPNNTEQISWHISDGGELIATANTGYQFSDGTTTHSYGLANDSGVLCTTPLPTESSAAVICGPHDNDIITIGSYNESFVSVNEGDWVNGTKTITYTITNPNYTFTDGSTQVTQTLTDTHTDCPKAEAPTFDDMTCDMNDTVGYTIPEHDTDTTAYVTVASDGTESDPIDAGTVSLLRLNQSITIRAYYMNELGEIVQTGEWTHAYTLPSTCTPGVGNITPTPETPTIIVPVVAKQAVITPEEPAVTELPHTGASDKPYMTILGLIASLATYGAVLALQRRKEA